MNLSQNQFDTIVETASVGFAGRLAGRFLVILQNLLVARMLGPAIFGLYAIGLSIFRLIEMIAPLGFDIGVIRFGSQYLSSEDKSGFKGIVYRSIVTSLLFSIVVGFLIFIFSDWISIHLYQNPSIKPVFQLFSILIPLSAVLAIVVAIGRINNQVRYSILIQDLVQPFLALLTLGVFWFLGIKLEFVIIADQLSYFIALLIIFYFLLRKTQVFSPTTSSIIYPKKEYYSFSLLSAGSIFLSTIAFWADRLIVGFYLAPFDMGVYQAGLQISALFAVLLGAFSRNILPIFSALYAERKMGELQGIFRIGTKWNFYLGLPFILFLCFNSTNILSIFYGSEYSQGDISLLILLAGQTVNLITGSVAILLLVGGFQKVILSLSFATLFVNIISCILFIPKFGIVGAAFSNAMSTAFLYFCLIIFTRKQMRLWPYDMHYIKGLIAIFITAAIIVISRHFWDNITLGNMIVEFLLSVAVFFVALLTMGFTPEDKVFLNSLFKQIGIFKLFNMEAYEKNKS